MTAGPRVAVYIGPARHQRQWCGAFAAGLRRHGLATEIVDGPAAQSRRPVECDIAVFWAHKRWRVIERQRDAGRDYIVLERAYLGGRTAMASAGYNGLNGRADFRNAGSPAGRWEKMGIPLVPWNPGLGYVLILGQVRGDQAIAGVDILAWYAAAAAFYRRWNAKVVFRPHPQDAATPTPPGALSADGETLAETLAGAALAVTYNSTSGVDAALAGVPVIAVDEGSMAWPAAGHELGALVRPDRAQWARDLAYCQWTEDEMASGETWEHLKRK